MHWAEESEKPPSLLTKTEDQRQNWRKPANCTKRQNRKTVIFKAKTEKPNQKLTKSAKPKIPRGKIESKLKAKNCNRGQLFWPCWVSSARCSKLWSNIIWMMSLRNIHISQKILYKQWRKKKFLCTSQIEASTSPPGNPPGIWIFGKLLFKFPPSPGRKAVQMPPPAGKLPDYCFNFSVASFMLLKLCMVY